MSSRRSFLLGAGVLAAALYAAPGLAQQKEVTIAYQDMLVPWRVAHAAGEVEKATGYKINFRQFSGGGDVIRALASNQVHIGEAGSAPIAAGLSQGLPVELFWILDDINDAEALVVRNGSGVNSVADLKGKRIGVPFTSTTHFHSLVALEHAGVNPSDVRIVNLRPPEIAAAWERGDIDATFVWEPVLSRVKASGKVLVSSGQIAKQTGKSTFDGIVVNRDWARQHGEFLDKFVQVLAAADESYRRDAAKWTAGSAEVAAVAKITGAKPEDVPAGIALYRFPTPAEQASATWLGGGAQGGAAQSLAATAAFLKSQGTIANVLGDYSVGVNPAYVERAAR
ncbi:taurine ABC transporter substrate-binding protein [Pseudothauera nasutitermitis]|uniref:Taurine ABC transporter substrate-binding protein n=1 Tax=Pseudothauera nasutitermitis TaxID=2565930 RepID=A0A4S4B4R3_9RHOO|nr:taurine ABC transporter substrate-binding protein [Pseudothauera nasutitermitis]THF67281.1 taurine ABC transporter substrate-binding protein [Pseudothauera nasutitermitis]